MACWSGLLLYALLSSTAIAQQAVLRVENAWARANPPVVPNSAAYMVIHNEQPAAERLLAASSTVAKHIEIHETTMKDNVMSMEHQEDGIAIAPSSTVNSTPTRRLTHHVDGSARAIGRRAIV